MFSLPEAASFAVCKHCTLSASDLSNSIQRSSLRGNVTLGKFAAKAFVWRNLGIRAVAETLRSLAASPSIRGLRRLASFWDAGFCHRRNAREVAHCCVGLEIEILK
jgi:hypothetical protein